MKSLLSTENLVKAFTGMATVGVLLYGLHGADQAFKRDDLNNCESRPNTPACQQMYGSLKR